MAKVIARPPTGDLYEEDFPLWAERQAGLLRARRFEDLDLDNLIEEVEDLSRRERKAIESYVETILDHFLKLAFSPAERPRRGWLVTIDKQRVKLARELTPTLRNHAEAELPALMPGSGDPWRDSLRRTACQRMRCPQLVPTSSTRSSTRTGTRITCTASETRRREAIMLLIPCPWCGERDETEFHCGGEAHIARPEQPMALSDDQWADYLFMRSNPKGLHFERWRHVHGCGRWSNVARDTTSDRILKVYRIGEPRPRVTAPEPRERTGARPGLAVVAATPDKPT